MLKPLLVPNYFHCNKLLQFMVKTFDCLPETTRTKLINHLPPIAEMIVNDDDVVAAFVIIAIVLRFS
jgi:hypothetical protein